VTYRSPVERAVVVAALVAAPALALARGEEIVFLPVGNVAAVASTILVGLLVRVGWTARLLAIVIAGAASLPPYFVAYRDAPRWLAYSELGLFALGFVPPVVASAAFLAAWRARRA
jgi:hypothetical protein